MGLYAKDTSVSIDKSKIEIEQTLKRYGIKEFFYGTSPRGDGIGFKFNDKLYKISIPLHERKKFVSENRYEQAMRTRYRVLLLHIKAKLEAVMDGQENFDTAFLAYLALPDGSTVGESVIKQYNAAIEAGKKPMLLLPGMEVT